jgi:hypothetical protein
MPLIDQIFNNIDLFRELHEIQDYCRAELRRRNINGVAEERPRGRRRDADWDYIDADQWPYSQDFLLLLVTDPRCPRWLSREIVWYALRGYKYD